MKEETVYVLVDLEANEVLLATTIAELAFGAYDTKPQGALVGLFWADEP